VDECQNMEKESEFFRSQSCFALSPKWVVFFAIFLTSTQLWAQTWNAGTSSWFVPENWTPAAVPTSPQSVLVDNGGTAQVGAAATAGSLTIGISTPGSTVQLLNRGILTVTNAVVVGTTGTLLSNGEVFANVFENSGVISNPTNNAISFIAGGSVINNATGTITAADYGIITSTQAVNITNYGTIVGTGNAIGMNGAGTIINKAGAFLLSTTFQPVEMTSNSGIVNITNSGTISSPFGGVGFDGGNTSGGTVTNNAGGVIQGTGANSFGIASGSTAPVTVFNAGLITGVNTGYGAGVGGSVTNEAGGVIQSTGANAQSAIGFGTTNGPLTIINEAGGLIQSNSTIHSAIGIGTTNGLLTIINSGTISGLSGIGFGGGSGSITNNATGSIIGRAGTGIGMTSVSSATILNAGTISSGLPLAGDTAHSAIVISGGTAMIVNSGTITSAAANAINIEAGTTGSIINNAGAILSGGNGHSAILGGTGQIDVLNAGIMNGGVNLGSGVSTLTLLTGGRINGTVNLGSNAGSNLVLDGSGSEAISQAVTDAITNPGALTKQGTGTWTLDEELSAPVSTKVLAGVLIVNSTLNTSVLNVEAGGTLAGSGIISGKVINAGTLSPGNSPGIFTVNGDYTQSATGTLRIEVAGLAPSEHDLLAVTGHASLAGTLQLIGLGGFTLHVGDQLTFLTANGGVSGSFGTVQNEITTGTIVKAQIVTLSNAVVLEAAQGSFVEAACNPNSAAVAQALDSAVGNPRASALITFLNGQPLNNLCGDFTLIAPEALASIFNAGVSFANVQTANLKRRLEDVRAGDNGFNSSGFSLNGGASNFGGGLAGVTGPEGKSGPSVMTPTPENRWGIWVTGIGEFANVESSNGAAGYDIQTGGVTFGVDYRVCSIFAVGLTAGYANMNVDLPNGGSLDVNSGQFGIYATLFGSGFYADAAFTGGPSGYDTHRTALLGSANGNTDGGNFNALIAVGYDWKKGGLSIGPTANFQYSYVGIGGFTESGSIAPLNIDNQNVESERTAIGMKASYEWKLGHVIIKPEISAAWQHEFGDQSYSIVASFANGAGNSFTVSSPPIGRDSLLIGAGTAVLLNDRISVYAYYDGELLRTNYQSNSVSAGVRMTF
jgi:outer membrane autotransporter protein